MKSWYDRIANSLVPNAVIILGVVVAIVIILFPPVIRERITDHSAYCASNLKQIGHAIKLYLADWDNTYPTNRPYTKNGKPGSISAYVKLTPPAVDEQTGEPSRFRYGASWVEGLYSCMEQITPMSDSSSVWRCSQVTSKTSPT